MIISYDKNPRLTEDEKLDSLSRSVQLALNEKADRDTVAETYIKASDVIDLVYPIGSYYETSDTAFNPNTAWGGTWVLDSKGRVTVSRDETITDFDTIGETGGEKTVTLTVDEMPNHSHKVRYTGRNANGNYGGMSGTSVDANPAYNKLLVAYEGGGKAHNNMPPYIVVNRWHRTA